MSGPKGAVVAHPDGTHRRLYCLETPESWFEDVGFGTLVNGRAVISLDPGFASMVQTDQYHVFVTEYDNNNALYVTARIGHRFRGSSRRRSCRFKFQLSRNGKAQGHPRGAPRED